MDKYKNAVLCYIKNDTAYFTTQPLDKQWGDDWDDAPYEHNAGTPYRPCWHREGGKECECEVCKRDWTGKNPNWEIIILKFDFDAEKPCDFAHNGNSEYSVKDINSKKVPWLKPSQWVKDGKNIYAGTTIQEFCETIMNCGGRIYREIAPGEFYSGTPKKKR